MASRQTSAIVLLAAYPETPLSTQLDLCPQGHLLQSSILREKYLHPSQAILPSSVLSSLPWLWIIGLRHGLLAQSLYF